MIWLEVRVAGRSTPLDFLLDSGAGQSVIDLAAARRLGLKLGQREAVQGVEGRCTACRVDGFSATVASIQMPEALLGLDLRPVSAGCGKRIDGLLGADFFRSRIVQIDFSAQRIRFPSRDELPLSGPEALPLTRRNDAFCVRVGVDGNAPAWMRVDTGCSGALEWVASGEKLARSRGASVAISAETHEHIRTDVLLGSERISAVKTGLHPRPMFSGEAGLVGNGLLSQFRVTFDVPKVRLLLERTKE